MYRRLRSVGRHALVPLLGLCAVAAPNAAVAQAYYQPKSSTQLYAYVCCTTAGQYFPYADIELGNTYYPGSNGHTHGPGMPVAGTAPPVSTSTPSSGYAGANGLMPFTLATGIVGQIEEIVVNSSLSLYATDYEIVVGYPDLYFLGNESGLWYQIGYSPNHGNSNSYNHSMRDHRRRPVRGNRDLPFRERAAIAMHDLRERLGTAVRGKVRHFVHVADAPHLARPRNRGRPCDPVEHLSE
jgi:hypothetical protein